MFRKSGGLIPKSTVAAILRNRIYTGRFDWDGKTYQGRYEAIVKWTPDMGPAVKV
jgi:hypothetical protein